MTYFSSPNTVAVNDATVLLRDIAGDAASNAASRVKPSDEAMSQIDRPADDNTWHDVPDMSRENLRNQARSQFNTQKPFSKDDVKNAAGNATQAASGSRDPRDAADQAARDQQHGSSSVDADQGARTGASNLRQQASENVPDETKNKTREMRDRSKNYMSDKFPQERREQAIFRLKKMIVEVQGHPDCTYYLRRLSKT